MLQGFYNQVLYDTFSELPKTILDHSQRLFGKDVLTGAGGAENYHLLEGDGIMILRGKGIKRQVMH